MYLLEDLNITDVEGYNYCVAWTRYFLNQGYQTRSQKKMTIS